MGDILRAEAIKRAESWRNNGWDVHFKFTCGRCGERLTLQEPNTLYEYGECFTCGYETKLDKVGFLVVKTMKEKE